uniref:Uncharacterized protein n=1 Tax=Staphylococcus arlettae TaxID=29378 RepID=A0A1W5QE51_9STAP|nr:hypothetical protein [Staphylococcus arlettae]
MYFISFHSLSKHLYINGYRSIFSTNILIHLPFISKLCPFFALFLITVKVYNNK